MPSQFLLPCRDHLCPTCECEQKSPIFSGRLVADTAENATPLSAHRTIARNEFGRITFLYYR